MSDPLAPTVPFGDAYRGRRVLVTGDTGFKGSWIVTWLLELGAEVTGYALAPPSEPALFDVLGLASRAPHVHGDIRHPVELRAAFERHRPELVLHLAAQPHVLVSYDDPAETFSTNVMGTLHVLDAARQAGSVLGTVVVTSDKCYENREWPWGYRERDRLGGTDPYGASKAAAELVARVYRHPALGRQGGGPLVVSARAGNVVGGGDWAPRRLVPDAVAALTTGTPLVLRHPAATRPWQHVLDAVSGYLDLGARVLRGEPLGDAYNFGPTEGEPTRAVGDVVARVFDLWGPHTSTVTVDADAARRGMEHAQLFLDCSLARHDLGWWSVWDLDETLRRTVEWYRAHATGGADLWDCTRAQIAAYAAAAVTAGVRWARADES